ncbi:MAG TPA: energy transducer TonB [Gammaproteobacteria bacterium]|nr:energy transducer TonB [Gammaproteobacteria bacterium]
MLSLFLEHRILFLLLSLSAALHGGVLWYEGDGSASNMTRTVAPISIALVQPAPAKVRAEQPPVKRVIPIADNPVTQTTLTRPVPKKKPDQLLQQEASENIISRPTTAARLSSAKPVARQPQQLPDETLPSAIKQPPETTPQPAVPVYSQLQAALQSRLRFNRHYPRSAIRRGWEGRVDLAVQIDTQGQIGIIRILRSSGHNLLDQAAIQSIEGLARLPEADILLDQQAIEITIPVIYKLE